MSSSSYTILEQKHKKEEEEKLIADERKKCELELKEGQIIKWSECGTTGKLKESYGHETQIYLRREGIRFFLQELAAATINDPVFWKDGKCTTHPRRVWNYIFYCRPKFSYSASDEVRKLSHETVPKLITKLCEDNPTSDFAFLSKLGTKRNWKKECSICLKDENIGTTCGCGHTEIVIFRPCGHAVCSLPCFKELMATREVPLKAKEFKVGDQLICIPSSPSVDLNNIPFACPVCRSKIERTFQAEAVRVPNSPIFDKAAKNICNILENY